MNSSQLEIKISKGSPADLKDMQDLFVSTVKNICIADYTENQVNVWARGVENTERWNDIIETQQVFIARMADLLVGYITLDNFNYIDMLFVHKEYQGIGIAHLLFDVVEKIAKENKQQRLTSDVSISAKNFFLRMGFQIEKEQVVVRFEETLKNYKMYKEIE